MIYSTILWCGVDGRDIIQPGGNPSFRGTLLSLMECICLYKGKPSPRGLCQIKKDILWHCNLRECSVKAFSGSNFLLHLHLLPLISVLLNQQSTIHTGTLKSGL